MADCSVRERCERSVKEGKAASKLALNGVMLAQKGDRSDLNDVLHGTDDTLNLDQSLLANREQVVIRSFRKAHPEFAGRFIDVDCYELIADPLEVERRIYQRLNRYLVGSASERIQRLAGSRSR
jgi:hypothetical protein